MPQFNEGNINSYLVPSGLLTGSLSNSGMLTGQIAIGSGGGTTDYNDLTNKPQINSVTLSGNKTTADLNISYNDLDDKPTIPAAQVNSDWNAESGVAEILNKPTIPSALGDLSDVNTTGAFNGAVLTYNNGNWDPEISIEQPPNVEALNNFTTTPALTTGQVLKMSHGAPVTEWTNGFVSYNELTDRPTIPDPQVNSDWNASSGVAEILNKPTIPNLTAVDITNEITLTKTSGEWTIDSYSAFKSGQTVQLTITLKGNGNTVNAGSNGFQGSIDKYKPVGAIYTPNFSGGTPLIGGLYSGGSMAARVCTANVTLSSSQTTSFAFLYLTSEV